MRKWTMILASALVLTMLPGCESKGGAIEQDPIEAMYIQKGEDFKLFVNTHNGLPFYAEIPDGTEELTSGDIVAVYGNGIMLESYPGQYPGVTKIEVTEQGEEGDTKQYQQLLDELYHEPDPAEPPFLNLEYHTEDAIVNAATNQGGVSWTYEDENGESVSYIADAAFILDWKELNDIRLKEPTDVYLHFSKAATEVEVIRYERTIREEGDTEIPEGEKVEVFPAEPEEETNPGRGRNVEPVSETETGTENISETEENAETASETEATAGVGLALTVESEENPEEAAGTKEYVLKELDQEGVYLVRATFEQGTVEYGFEVLPAKKS